MLRKFHRSAVLLIFAAVFSVNAALFRLEGYVPSEVDTAALRGEYFRIWKQIDTLKPPETRTVIVTYYRRSDERRGGSRLPEWGGGGAIGKDSIVIPIDRALASGGDLFRTTVHELVHIELSRAYGYLRLPRWFHEGLAMSLSGELSFEQNVIVSRAIFFDKLLSLEQIERVNLFDAYMAQLAYCQSHLAIDCLVATYGIDAIPEILAAAYKRRSLEKAFNEVLGLTLSEFESMVKKFISQRYRYVFLMADTYLFWIAALGLAVVGYVLTRIRNRKRLEKLEAEDVAEDREQSEIGEGENSAQLDGSCPERRDPA